MTNHANISITFTIENEKQNKLHFKLSAETLGKDLKRIEESLKVRLNASSATYLDDRIRETAMKGVKVIGTEKLPIVTEAGEIEVNRWVYRKADGKRVKPLDQLLEIAPYERRNHAVREIESVIAARSNYRSAAEACTKISGVPVSAATIGGWEMKQRRRIRTIFRSKKERFSRKCYMANQTASWCAYKKIEKAKSPLKSEWRLHIQIKCGCQGREND